MSVSQQIAKHFRELHFGGNWTYSYLKEHLADVTFEESVTKVYDLNTIAALVFHINYFVVSVIGVLQGGPLEGHDKYSFDHPPIRSEQDWKNMLDKLYQDAETFAVLVEQLPDDTLWTILSEEKYGSFYRNLHGIIEHSHYHLGQIVVIKKIIRQNLSSAPVQ